MDKAKLRPLLFAGLLALGLGASYIIKPAPKPGAPGAQHEKDAKSASVPKPAEQPSTPAPVFDAAALAQEKLATIETPDFIALVSSLNGGLKSYRPKAARYSTRGKPINIVSTDKPAYYPLAIELKGDPAAAAGYQLQQTDTQGVLLTHQSEGLRVSRKVEAGQGPYQLWLTTHIENLGSAPRKVQLEIPTHHYVTREEEGSNVPLLPVRSSKTSHGVCRHSTDLERVDRKSGQTPHQFGAPVTFAGVENVYFLSAVAPDNNAVESCSIQSSDRGRNGSDASGSLFSARVTHKALELAPGETKTYRTLAYLGPKSPAELAAAGHSLKLAIESGWFTSLAEGLTWLLRKIHDGVGNWGIAIVLLTLLVKVTLFPLTARQMQSMAKMKELKPELDRINELYGDDREKKGAAIMELYRKRGINPMAGCLPVLMQLPIWFSLYASLSSNVELFRAPFALWWTDLSSPDPYFTLPLALGALMFVQQKISPATGTDPMQQKMMLYVMPIMITSFMLFLPAGLCLYMLTNSALSIGQQKLIEAQLKNAAKGTNNPATLSSSGGTSPGAPEEAIAMAGSKANPRAARPSKAERRWRRGKR